MDFPRLSHIRYKSAKRIVENFHNTHFIFHLPQREKDFLTKTSVIEKMPSTNSNSNRTNEMSSILNFNNASDDSDDSGVEEVPAIVSRQMSVSSDCSCCWPLADDVNDEETMWNRVVDRKNDGYRLIWRPVDLFKYKTEEVNVKLDINLRRITVNAKQYRLARHEWISRSFFRHYNLPNVN